MIAVAGEALIDVHFNGGLLRPFPGGGPFNTAIALARLGVPTYFLGAISRDRFGRELERTLRAAGVNTERVVCVDAPTSLAIVGSTAAEPSYGFYLAGTAHQALDPSDLVDQPLGPRLALSGSHPGQCSRAAAGGWPRVRCPHIRFGGSRSLDGVGVVPGRRARGGGRGHHRSGRRLRGRVDRLALAGRPFVQHAVRNLGERELEAALGYASAVAAAQCTPASDWGPTAADVERLLKTAPIGRRRITRGEGWLRSSSMT